MKSHPKIIDRILEGIRASQSICVVGHILPDGDCIGSQLGLTLALKNEARRKIYEHFNRHETVGTVVAEAIAAAQAVRLAIAS